jgi:hypothetical protein
LDDQFETSAGLAPLDDAFIMLCVNPGFFFQILAISFKSIDFPNDYFEALRCLRLLSI